MKVRLACLLAGGLLWGVASAAARDARAQFEFPNPKHWEEFVAKLESVLQGSDPAALARFEPEARRALAGLQEFPGSEEYVAWLQERIDYISMAKYLDGVLPALPPPPQSANQRIPHYDLWLQRLRTRPQPDAAEKYVAALRRWFVSAGVPAELVWLAEVESSFDPFALSPAGARGLYQLMPDTARELGLSTSRPDERVDPQKSAEAAAKRLGALHRRFGDWPLALAAYNAGAGYVQRALKQKDASTFAEIAPVLPLETRMYVPKVLAVLQVRAGVTLVEGRP
jgi:membrane-bound lytic murein transglycosylase D